MKSLLASFLLFFVAAALSEEQPIINSFEEFKRIFNKKYKSKFDEVLAKIRFTRSLVYIEDQNKNSHLTFKLSINKFADQHPQIFTQLARESSSLVSNRFVSKLITKFTKIPPGPPFIDYRETGCISPVKDQEFECSAGYAFSAVAAVEAHWCLKNNINVVLSELQVLACSYNKIYGNWVCNGGSATTTFEYISRNGGIHSQEQFSIESLRIKEIEEVRKSSKCFNKSMTTAATVSSAVRVQPNETLLADVVAHAGPVTATMNGSIQSFWFYARGVFNDPSCRPSTSHFVLIVGYGTDYGEDGRAQPYWLCKNSWGTDWGDKGYFKIQRGVNMCGIMGVLSYPEVPKV